MLIHAPTASHQENDQEKMSGLHYFLDTALATIG
jgi:hypothetical protein